MKVLTTEKLSYNPYILNKYHVIRMTYCGKPPVLPENPSGGFNLVPLSGANEQTSL